jgi:hypothetical protein
LIDLTKRLDLMTGCLTDSGLSSMLSVTNAAAAIRCLNSSAHRGPQHSRSLLYFSKSTYIVLYTHHQALKPHQEFRNVVGSVGLIPRFRSPKTLNPIVRLPALTFSIDHNKEGFFSPWRGSQAFVACFWCSGLSSSSL